MEGFERLSRIKPSSGSRFELDKLTVDPRRRELNELLEVIKKAKQEFRDDCAAHVWSTYKIIRDNTKSVIDATMNDKLADVIIGFLDNRKYQLRIKFIVGAVEDIGDDTCVIRVKNDPILANGKTILLSKVSRPGMLTKIDIPYYSRAYPVISVVYGIYAVKKPKPDKLKTMKTSVSLNCVAEQVIEHFKNAKRRNGLTDLRLSRITFWGSRVKDTEASIADVVELDKSLRFPITVATITGETLYASKYNCYGASIKIIDHNSHASTDAVTIFRGIVL